MNESGGSSYNYVYVMRKGKVDLHLTESACPEVFRISRVRIRYRIQFI